MARPTVKDADFVGRRRLPRAARDGAGGHPVHPDRRRPDVVQRGQALHARPRADPDRGRRADRRRQGPPLVRDQRRVRSVGRQAHPAVRTCRPSRPSAGTKLAVEYFGERYPVTVAVVGADAAVRSRQRRACRASAMNILVCVKRVPATGGKITLTADEQDDRHAVPRLHGQPARGVRGRGGGPAGRGARRDQRRSSRSARPRPTEQLRDAMAIGIDRAILLRPTAASGTRSPRPARSSTRSGRARRPTVRST